MKTLDPYTDKISFGKYNGKTYDEISEIDPSYVIWLTENVKSIRLPKSYVNAIQWDLMEEDEIYLDACGGWYSCYD